MKKRFTFLVFAAGSFCSLNAQIVQLQENFNDPFIPSAAGWFTQNNSASPTALSWFQGNGSTFAAFNGGGDNYFASNYQVSNSSSGATLSSWLITPTVTLVNGGVLEFATRTVTNPTTFADRLEVYISSGTGTNVGTSPTSLGSFSTSLITVNAGLTGTGYPDTWTIYTATISGLPATTVGRVGFRYHVTNGGPGGANSDFIGLDAVKYTANCIGTVESHTICSGLSTTLSAVTTASAATYTWAPGGQNTSSISVSPSSTQVYTLTYTEANGVCPVMTSTVTVGSSISMNIIPSSSAICAGETVTLAVQSGAANTFSWSSGQTTPVITLTPAATAVYSVGGIQFPNLSCGGFATVSIVVNNQPTVTAALSQTLLCAGTGSASVQITGSGASTYNWSTSLGNISGSPLTFTTANTYSAPLSYSFQATGIDANGCSDTNVVMLYIDMQPTVTIAGNTTVCANGTIALAASGADNYQWLATVDSPSASAVTYTAGSSAGPVTVSVTGTSTHGCTHTIGHSIMVMQCGTGTITGVPQEMYSETSVYPNPFSNELRITGANGKVVIYNALGQQVFVKTVRLSETLDTADLPKGAYIIQVQSTEGEIIKTVRAVKN